MTPYSYREDPNVPDFTDDRAVIVFDGMCVMCSRFMRFALQRDRNHRFNFLPAQSPTGEALFAHYGLKEEDYESILLIENGELRVKWDASVAIFETLGWPWKLAILGRLLPRPFANFLYRFIARNRFKWFGRRKVCLLPTGEEWERFI